MEPVARRQEVNFVREKFTVSERRACGLLGMDRKSYRYRSRRGPDNERLRQRLRELAEHRRRFGYKRPAYFAAARRLESEPQTSSPDLCGGKADGAETTGNATVCEW